MPRKKRMKMPLGVGDFQPLIRKTRRPRGTGIEKELTKLTHAQFASRHEYCINVGDIADYIKYYVKRAEEQGTTVYIPKDTKAVCNHPEDGICSHNPITDEQLAEVNTHLDGTWNASVDLEIQPKKKRGRPVGSKNKPKVRITGGSTIFHKGIIRKRNV